MKIRDLPAKGWAVWVIIAGIAVLGVLALGMMASG
jgi:hypothetical protein